MRIEPNEIIAGMPATQTRALLRRIDEGRITPEVVAELLTCRKIRASRIIRQLEAEGYVTAKRDRHLGDHWESTVKGKALAAATAARPLHRETAERLVADLLERVRLVNADDQWAYRIQTVALFGSCVGPKERPNDVDIACKLVPRWRESNRQETHEQERRARCGRFANTLEWAYWPQKEVLKFLRARSRGLSIHLFDDWVKENTEHKTLYAG
jgi:DNA-binding MarR family transcriptional regulator